MSNYGKFCPVAMGSDVIADRWTPLIVRELVLGNTRFNDIARGLPGISRSLLVQRLKHLERQDVLERWPSPLGRGFEYRLTPAGRDLERVLAAIGQWAVRWRFDEIRADTVDAVTLTWWMHRHVDPSQFPPTRVVVQFDHTAPVRQSLWILLDRGEASVCTNHPGFDPDIVVTASTAALADVFRGLDSWQRATSTDTIRVDGPRRLVRSLPLWFQTSSFAEHMRMAAAAAS